MSTLLLTATARQSRDSLGAIGGTPELPNGSEWPRCRLCGHEMVAFLDLRLPMTTESPFQAGSRLQVFACREHDDIAGSIYSDYSLFTAASQQQKLPGKYWDITDGHFLLRLISPTTATSATKREDCLAQHWITAEPTDDATADGFKLFGVPSWLQDPEDHVCACGAPMKLLLQVPAGYGFPMAPNAPAQPNSFSQNQYCLFLSNQLDLLACAKQCHPLALWPVLQN